jgi:uncharacterized membrane protein (DUF2068 family)
VGEGAVESGQVRGERDGGLRAIIVLKAFYGILFFLVGLGFFALINKDVSDLAEQAADSLGIDPENQYLLLVLESLTGVSPKQIAAVGLGTILTSGLLLTMAWGLHLRQAWAEWLTIVWTGFFIPIEIYEVVRSPHLTYALALAVNALIVWYLVRRRIRSASSGQERPEASLSRETTGSPTLRS